MASLSRLPTVAGIRMWAVNLNRENCGQDGRADEIHEDRPGGGQRLERCFREGSRE